jgi:hypothetical protein
MSAKCKKGDVLRFTQYYYNMHCEDPRLKKGQILWGIATGYDEFEILDVPGTERVIDNITVGRRGDALTGWGMTPSEDEYTVIPQDEWPDEVCVAMAQMALRGEQNG